MQSLFSVFKKNSFPNAVPLLCLLLFFAGLFASPLAAADPFGASPESGRAASNAAAKQAGETGETVESEEMEAFGEVEEDELSLWDRFVAINRAIQEKVSGYLSELHREFSLSMLLWILLISIGYGFVHSSGPGHGKALVASYFLDNGEEWRDAARMGLIISVTHTGSALLIATIFQLILLTVPEQSLQMQLRSWFTVFSGVFIVGVGIHTLIEKIRYGRATEEAHEKERVDKLTKGKKRSALMVGIAAGIVPCPLSMAIMFLAISFGIYYVGVLSVLGMSAGMFLLLFIIGFMTIRSRRGLENRLGAQSKFKRFLTRSAGIASGALIVVLGILVAASGLV